MTESSELIVFLLLYTGKKRRFFKVFKVAGKIFITTVSKENFEKSEDETMVEFHPQSTQRLIIRYEHMNSRNDRLMMQLKAIEAEYYSIEN